MNITVTSPFEQVIKESKEWKPTVKQERFLRVPFDVDEGGYGGALGAGKSDVLMLMPLVYGFHEQPKYSGLFLRRTFPELESEIIPRSREFFPSTGAVYDIAKHIWRFPRGGRDAFGHCKDEKDVKKYDTVQAALIRFDEATSFTGWQYEYLVLRRNRSPVGFPFPAFTRWGSNPGNVGHSYFRKRFVDPYRGKIFDADKVPILKDAKTGAQRIFIPATATDNPHLLEANPKYFAKLEGITSEAERKAMILGDWYTFEGQVFDEFRREPLPDEPEHAQHIISPFMIPDWWPKLVGIDWGFNAWCYIIWATVSPEGRVFIYRTYAVKKVKIRNWTREFAKLSIDEIDQIRDIRICFSATQDQGHDQTIFEQVGEALQEAGFKCSLTLGDRNRVAGKQLIHEYLRWRPLPPVKNFLGEYNTDLARRIERMHGSEALKDYASYYAPEKIEHNLPKLQFFDLPPEGDKDAPSLAETLSECVYDEKKIEDVKEFTGDDPYDCLRILLNGVRDYFDEAKEGFELQQKIGLANSKLIPGQDQTAFYRACEAAEIDEHEDFSVRRVSGLSRQRRSSRY